MIFKLIRKVRVAAARKLFPPVYSDLALEIREALEQDAWTGSRHTLTHPSGLELWMANGRSHFHIHELPRAARQKKSGSLGDVLGVGDTYKHLLTEEECEMLAPLAFKVHARVTETPVSTVTNALRLARQTKEN